MIDGIRCDAPAMYRIRIMENLGSEWNEWFGGLTVTRDSEEGSVLTGTFADQAALYGLIRKLRDLHLTLLSLYRIESQPERKKNS